MFKSYEWHTKVWIRLSSSKYTQLCINSSSSITKTDNDEKVTEGDSSSLNFHDDNANASFPNFTFNQSVASASGETAPDDESTRTQG